MSSHTKRSSTPPLRINLRDQSLFQAENDDKRQKRNPPVSSSPTTPPPDEHDGPYVPEHYGSSLAKSSTKVTPEKRIERGSSVASSQQSRIRTTVNRHLGVQDKALSTSSRQKLRICAITGYTHEMDDVQFSHVTPRATGNAILTKLEWVWNMQLGTLNLDTRKNVHTIIDSIHKRFDHMNPFSCLWLPWDVEILRQFEHNWKLSTTRLDPNSLYGRQKKFAYRFIASPEMKNFLGFQTYKGPLTDVKKGVVEQHLYPFTEVPPLTLTIFPHFVVYDTGRKLETLVRDQEPSISLIHNHFSKLTDIEAQALIICFKLYKRWMSATPSGNFLAGSILSPSADEQPDPGSSSTSTNSRATRASMRSKAASAQHKNTMEASGSRTCPDDSGLVAPDDSASCMDVPSECDDDEEGMMKEGQPSQSAPEGIGGQAAAVKAWTEDVWRQTFSRLDFGLASQVPVGSPEGDAHADGVHGFGALAYSASGPVVSKPARNANQYIIRLCI
ncbi:hypothetical protein HGRIS_005430 [Hohenbuehelia grisea]|uniref:HNH nuclease domain-containing protein n=1 Tax=Hohenbuehelia grisea TaxID=104357 RepID=A0ABR3JXQ2_9AGAR